MSRVESTKEFNAEIAKTAELYLIFALCSRRSLRLKTKLKLEL